MDTNIKFKRAGLEEEITATTWFRHKYKYELYNYVLVMSRAHLRVNPLSIVE